MDIKKLPEEIIEGRRLGRADDLSFFADCELQPLLDGADVIREEFCGDEVELCTIINGRSGRCSEDCKYCAQSAFHHTECEIYEFLDEETILHEAKSNYEEGVDRFSIVTSGMGLSEENFAKAMSAYQRIGAECENLDLCASHGSLTQEQFRLLKECGVTRYHANIETSEENFPNICTTHTFADKIACIKSAQAEGLDVCSGGIIGMGESWEDRISMAVSLSELGIESIPLNALMPIPGTPLADLPRITEDDILRTVAIFRFINPTANIRLAAGRALVANDGERAFRSGASATITGNMLTTSGSTIQSDRKMLKEMDRTVCEPEKI